MLRRAPEDNLEGCWRIMRHLFDVGEEALACRTPADQLCARMLEEAALLTHADDGMVAHIHGSLVDVVCLVGICGIAQDADLRRVVYGWCDGSVPIATYVRNPDGLLDHETEPAILVAPIRVHCRPLGCIALRKPGVFTSGERGIVSTVSACLGPRAFEGDNENCVTSGPRADAGTRPTALRKRHGVWRQMRPDCDTRRANRSRLDTHAWPLRAGWLAGHRLRG